MLEAAPFGCFGVPLNLRQLLLHFFPVQVVEGDAALVQTGHLQISDVINLACIFKDRRHIRRNIGFTVRHADDHRAVFSGHPDLSRIIPEKKSQRIGTPHTDHRLRDGVHGTDIVFFVVIIHQLDYDLRIRLGIEGIAMLQQLFLQFLIILYDPVMHPDNIVVIGYMRVRVRLGRFSMGRPAGMPDPAVPLHCPAIVRFLRQYLQPSLGFYDLDVSVPVANRHSGRIIAPVFEFGQPVQKDRRRLLSSCKTYDSTHIVPPFLYC